MNEFFAILKDIAAGTLALTAIPGFIWFLITKGKKAFRS